MGFKRKIPFVDQHYLHVGVLLRGNAQETDIVEVGGSVLALTDSSGENPFKVQIRAATVIQNESAEPHVLKVKAMTGLPFFSLYF